MTLDFSTRTKTVVGVCAPLIQAGLIALDHYANLADAAHTMFSTGLFAIQAALLFLCWGTTGGTAGIVSAALCFVHFTISGLEGHRIPAIVLGSVALAAGASQRKRLQSLAHVHRRAIEEMTEQMNEIVAERDAQTARIEGLLRRFHKFPLLSRVCEEMGATLEEDELVELIVRQSVSLIDSADEAVLFFAFQGGHKLEFRSGFPAPKEPTALRPPSDADQFVFQQRRSYVCERTSADIFKLDRQTDGHVASFISTPLMLEESDSGRIVRRTLGVLRLNSSTPGAFRGEDMEMLTIMSTLSAMSLENAALYQRRREMSITDDLTGLFSQHYFRERFAQEIVRATRENIPLSFAMMDLDHFKAYNDEFGHLAGDQVLKQFAAILRNMRERGDIVVRYGGEEFAILAEATQEQTMVFAERLRERVARTPLGPPESRKKITVSIGVASFPIHGLDVEELIDKADAALYRAKEQGRNRVCPA